MRLHEAFDVLPEVVPAELDRFRRHIDHVWVEEALMATGTATVRRRRLPADQVLWLVVGMALLRNESLDRVVAWLDLALPDSRGGTVAKSAIAQARQRLGEDPVAYLFVLTAAVWAMDSAARHRWRGLSLFGLDGTTLRVPDSPENWQIFGGQVGNGQRNGSAYPTVRILGLMALRSHMLAALVFDQYHTGETTLAQDLWRELPDDSLTIGDRNFLVAHQLVALERSGRNRHWLTRGKTQMQLRRIRPLARNDELVEIMLSPATRRLHPELPETWVARAIRYQRKGFPPSTLLTSLMDADAYPAVELVALYHERWEIEIAYDEIKTHLLAREETIRSRTPQGVRQEIWGIALAYNLVRVEMERVADDAGVAPTRISFVNALALVRYTWLISSMPPLAPGKIPSRLLDMRTQLKLLVLAERRPDRAYPRAVKIKMSNYLRKPPSGGGRK
jgi:IS4 transposase